MYPKDHSIIEYKLNKFINNCDLHIKPIMRKLFNNNAHISFEKFMTYLIKNFKFIIENTSKNLYVYIPDNFKNKSNYWIYTLMNHYKTRIGYDKELILITSLKDERLIDDDIILVPDDCIYSGEQMKQIIEDMINKRNLNLNIHLFVSFMTVEGINKITEEFNNNSYLNNCKLYLANYIYNIESKINKYLSIKEIKILEEYYSISINNRYLIYFDHKVADHYSTIPLIYSGIVASYNNKITLNLIRKAKQDLKDKLEFIQFIKHTDNIRNINVLTPDIIIPPYN